MPAVANGSRDGDAFVFEGKPYYLKNFRFLPHAAAKMSLYEQ